MPKLLIAFLIFLSSISFSYSQNVEVFKFTDEELSNLKVRKVRGAKNMTEYSILTEDEVQEKALFPDFTDVDHSIGKDGEVETYLMISTNQFS